MALRKAGRGRRGLQGRPFGVGLFALTTRTPDQMVMVGGGVDRGRAMEGGPPQSYPVVLLSFGLGFTPEDHGDPYGRYVYVD